MMRALRNLGSWDKTQSILYDDVYGWFERIDRGVYALGEDGRAALAEFADVVEAYREKIDSGGVDQVA